MYSPETVEIALRAIDGGSSVREAAALAGVSKSAVARWAAGRAPRARRAGRIRAVDEDSGVTALNDDERAAYDAAMEENALLKAVLDDLKRKAPPRLRRRGGDASSSARDCARRQACP